MNRTSKKQRRRKDESKKQPKVPKSDNTSEQSVHIQLCPYVQEVSIARDEYSSSDGSTISLTPSAFRRQRFETPDYEQLNDWYSVDAMREKGWCNRDGTPWLDACPCDEAALLKKGLISRDCKRQTYGRPSSKKVSPAVPSKEARPTKRVGRKSDSGTLKFMEENGVRTYELKTCAGTVTLETSKNHTYLVSSLK